MDIRVSNVYSFRRECIESWAVGCSGWLVGGDSDEEKENKRYAG